MSQGRPLADTPDAFARTLVLGFLVVPAALLVASALDPDALTAERLAVALAVQAGSTALFAGLEGWSLWRAMRRAEPTAGPIADTGPPPDPKSAGASAIAAFVLIVGVALLFGTVSGLVVDAAALLLGERLGHMAAHRLARRRERRLGRRFYRTVGEPEKVVWLGASGLE